MAEIVVPAGEVTASRSLTGCSPESRSMTAAPIADWTSRYGKDGYAEDMSGAGVELPQGFTKPVIMLSAVGGELTRGHSKIGWL